eukprot:TRINITY_DN62128_c0_g1_i1.p1 TRINITY_DN62128_c0_g1~~TRINITY_DN62128_c0_g1_i1.p1  ORF type:complete len:573 (+),score=47.26 TRINITY_DN62128_c0_g1_i1:49-1767(+)
MYQEFPSHYSILGGNNLAEGSRPLDAPTRNLTGRSNSTQFCISFAMMSVAILLLASLTSTSLLPCVASNVTIKTALGDVPNVTIKTALGDVHGRCDSNNMCTWLNIPYAEPFERFAPSQVRTSPYPEHGVGSLGFGPACIQFFNTLGPLPLAGESEDCLSINIWAARGAEKLPTMVFIFGGGFVEGTAGTDFYDGAKLASHGVVLVSLNYRLGTLGFVRMLDGSGGALGLGDQITALEWVKSFIHGFGGDPGKVTIFGESSGSVSVTALMHSPLAAGLFHRVIAESGVCYPSIDVILTEQDTKRVYAKFWDKANVSQHEYRTMPPKELVNITIASAGSLMGFFESGVGQPFVDGHVLPASPLHLRPLPVDAILGVNSWDNPMNNQIPGGRFAYFKQWLGEASDDILHHYYNASDRDRDIVEDACIKCQTADVAHRLSKQWRDSQVFVYIYDFPHDNAMHGEELAAVFGDGNPPPFSVPPPSLVKLVQQSWTTFAASGSPDQTGDWPRVATSSPVHAQVLSLKPAVVLFEAPACQSWNAALARLGPSDSSKMCLALDQGMPSVPQAVTAARWV